MNYRLLAASFIIDRYISCFLLFFVFLCIQSSNIDTVLLPLLLLLELCDRFCNYPDSIIWSCLLSLNHSTSSRKHIWRVGAFNSDTYINLSRVGMPPDRATTSDNSLTIIENRQSLITMKKSTIFIAIHSSISINRTVFPPLEFEMCLNQKYARVKSQPKEKIKSYLFCL